jgi:hypothetical protein
LFVVQGVAALCFPVSSLRARAPGTPLVGRRARVGVVGVGGGCARVVFFVDRSMRVWWFL